MTATPEQLAKYRADCARAIELDAREADESHLEAQAIVDCGLCDDDGYQGLRVCDHVDRRESTGHARATAALKAAQAQRGAS